jgi:hypothetical protein
MTARSGNSMFAIFILLNSLLFLADFTEWFCAIGVICERNILLADFADLTDFSAPSASFI